MKCRSCGYPLWNLREPRCPECGREFRTDQWTFAVGAVRFRCPHCAAEHPQKEPGFGWTRCPSCGERFAWRRAMVDPVDRNAQGIARRRRRRRKPPAFSRLSLYAAVLLFFFAVWFALAPTYSGSLRFGRLPTLPILWVMGSISVACIGISLAARRYWKRNVIVWGTLATLSSALVLSVHFSWQSGHADFMRRTTAFDHLGEMVRAASFEPEPIITYAELLIPGEYAQDPEMFLLWDSQRTPADVVVGAFTLADIASGAVSREVLRGTLGRANSPSEWEYIGDFLVSRRNDLLWEEDPKIVMGVSAVYSDEGLRCAIFADGDTDLLHVTESWIREQDDYRASLGLEPLPSLP